MLKEGSTTMMETDQRFYVRQSTIPEGGEGLFAAVSLLQCDRLRVVGVLIAANSVSDRCTRYADPYKVRVGEYLLIPTGWCAMVNHREDANVEKVIEARTSTWKCFGQLRRMRKYSFDITSTRRTGSARCCRRDSVSGSSHAFALCALACVFLNAPASARTDLV
jgi:hypothetical protein